MTLRDQLERKQKELLDAIRNLRASADQQELEAGRLAELLAGLTPQRERELTEVLELYGVDLDPSVF